MTEPDTTWVESGSVGSAWSWISLMLLGLRGAMVPPALGIERGSLPLRTCGDPSPKRKLDSTVIDRFGGSVFQWRRLASTGTLWHGHLRYT